MKKEFNLSKKIIKKSEVHDFHDTLIVSDGKEFIKRQIDRINKRLDYLSDFSGLAEAELQMAELRNVKNSLIKDAGEKLCNVIK